MQEALPKPTGIRNNLISATTRSARLGLHIAGRLRTPKYNPESILVIKLCCIGDLLMATPAIRALKETYPDAKVSVLVSSWAKLTLAGNPNVDEIIDAGPMEEITKPITYLDLTRTIKKKQFDACLVLERSAVISALPLLAGIPLRAGIDSFGRGFSLNRPVKWDKVLPETELYLDVARAIGCHVSSTNFEFHPAPEEELVADHLLKSRSLLGEGPLVAMHVGGASNPLNNMPSKRWPPERFAALADLIQERYKASVLILGAASDRQIADKVLAKAKSATIDLVGKLDLGEVAALCRRCDLYIGNDTGVTHLAAAVGTPVVAIFGPTSPVVYRPFGPAVEAVGQDVGCNPCFNFGSFNKECCETKCIEAVTIEDVWQAVQRLLPNR